MLMMISILVILVTFIIINLMRTYFLSSTVKNKEAQQAWDIIWLSN